MKDSERGDEYEKIFQEKLVYLKDLNSRSVDTWNLEAEKDGVKIYSIYDDKTGLKIIRAQTVFKAPALTMVEVAEEIDPILEWDKTLDSIRALYRSKDYNVIHMIIKKIPFTVQREAIVIAKFMYDDDGTIYGVGTSLDEHPDVEDTIYRVRASASLIGWVLKPDPVDPEKTELTYILNIDPKGWIPKTAFNWFAYTQGYNVKPFAEYVEARYQKDKLKSGGAKNQEKPRIVAKQKLDEEILSPTGKL